MNSESDIYDEGGNLVPKDNSAPHYQTFLKEGKYQGGAPGKNLEELKDNLKIQRGIMNLVEKVNDADLDIMQEKYRLGSEELPKLAEEVQRNEENYEAMKNEVEILKAKIEKQKKYVKATPKNAEKLGGAPTLEDRKLVLNKLEADLVEAEKPSARTEVLKNEFKKSKLRYEYIRNDLKTMERNIKYNGAKAGELIDPRNPKFNLLKFCNSTKGKVTLSIIALAALGVLIAYGLGAFEKTPGPLPPQQEALAIQRSQTEPTVLMQEWCKDMDSAASIHEGAAYDNFSVKGYHSLLTALDPVWTLAYEEASRSVIQNATAQPIVNWGAGAPVPANPAMSVHVSETDRNGIMEEHQRNLETHALTEFVRPYVLQRQFTEELNDGIHQAAFLRMLNSTALPFGPNSRHFREAYIGMYARMNVHSQCANHFREKPAIVAQFKELRALQAIRHADRDAAMDLIFEARSALPVTEPVSAA